MGDEFDAKALGDAKRDLFLPRRQRPGGFAPRHGIAGRKERYSADRNEDPSGTDDRDITHDTPFDKGVWRFKPRGCNPWAFYSTTPSLVSRIK
jgi:hypothetical protein